MGEVHAKEYFLSNKEHYNHNVLSLLMRLILVLKPGEIRVIDPDYIAEMFIMSTHNMPLNFLIDQLGRYPR